MGRGAGREGVRGRSPNLLRDHGCAGGHDHSPVAVPAQASQKAHKYALALVEPKLRRLVAVL